MLWKSSKVSLIVTNYNYGEYLDECLTSVENQTFQDFELVVIDDCSTDNSREVMAKHNPPRWIALKEHKGQAYCTNVGLVHANGEYVFTIDSDDMLHPEYIAKCVKALDENPDAGIAYTDMYRKVGDEYQHICFTDYSFLKLKKGNFILGSAMFRKSAFKQTRGFDETLTGMQDYDLWLSICELGWKAVHVPEPLYTYRIHDRNRSHGMDIKGIFKTIWDKHNYGKKPHVLAEVCTKGRYHTTLPMTIEAIALQTRKPDYLLILDDGEHVDVRQYPVYNHLFRTLEDYGINWEVLWTEGKGQHFSHQIAQDKAKDLVWRVDDDAIPEPNCLAELLSEMENDVGAVGGEILTPPLTPYPPICSNKMEDILWSPNYQWFRVPFKNAVDVDHLHCSFLYRAGIAKYDLNLSPVAHTEETLFTYSIRREGFRIVFNPRAVTWHFRNPEGGIRSYSDPGLWARDEAYFHGKLREWDIKFSNVKFVYLDNGLGDHLAFKNCLPELQARHDRIIISCCYPEVFEGEEKVEIISIASAKSMVGDAVRYNVYKWMLDNNWQGQLKDAFRRMYVG